MSQDEDFDDLDWDDLRMFAAIADTGSLSGAARMLGVTPSSVSKHLEGLERRLQARLTARHPGGVKLTEVGEQVRDHALTMQRSARAIEQIAKGRDTKLEGRVTLATPDGTAAFWITPRLQEFFRDNPKIRMAIECGFYAATPLPEGPDLSIVPEKDERKLDQVYAPLCTFHYAILAAPDYIAKHGAPKTLPSIAEHRAIFFTGHTRSREKDPTVAAIQALVVPTLETNSSAVVLQAIRAGVGIALAPTAVLTVAPELVMIGEQPVARVPLWLSYHRDAMKTTRLKIAAEWLKSVFDARDNPWFRDEFIHPRDFRAAEPRKSRA